MNLETLSKLEIKYKKIIAEELLRRANEDECLMNKLLSTDKTIEDCFKYIKSEAKKQAVENCTVLTDEEVYQLAQHFFLEDSITAKKEKNNKQQEENAENEETIEETTSEIKTEKKQPKVNKKEELKKKLYDGLDLFSI